MAYTTTFLIEKPVYKVLRYDVPINANFDKLDSGLKCWPSGTQPGDAGNYDEIVLTEGVLWRDTTNHKLKIRGASAWETIHSDTGVNDLVNASAPGASITDGFRMYSNDQAAGNACPHFRTESGTIIKLYQQVHIADVDTTVVSTLSNSYGTADNTLADVGSTKCGTIDSTTISTLTNSYGTADNTLEDIGATNTGDVSGAIENNFQECTAQINNLKTVVDSIRTNLGNESDQSATIEDNFKECTTQINNLKTVVDSLRTKLNSIFTYLENLGFNASA